MRPPRLLVLLAVIAAVGFAPAPFPRPGKKRPPDDLVHLQGTWKLIRYEVQGKDWLPTSTTPWWKVQKDRIHTIQRANGAMGNVSATYTFRLDRTKDPRGFDLGDRA